MFDSIDLKQLNALKVKLHYAQSILKLTNILLSSLHVWSIDNQLDNLFEVKLGISKPKHPIAFGRISRGAHVFVMFPAKRVTFNFKAEQVPAFSNAATLPALSKIKSSFNLIDFNLEPTVESKSMQPLSKMSSLSEEAPPRSPETPSPTREHWLSAKFLTTEHLLAILSISNSFMSLTNFIDLQLKNEYIDYDPLEFILGETGLTGEDIRSTETHSTIKQTYSRLSTMYCMINDYFLNDASISSIKAINLETLALKWMDPSYEVIHSNLNRGFFSKFSNIFDHKRFARRHKRC